MDAIKQFVKDRDEMITRFVMDDDLDAVKKHLKKYGQWKDAPKSKKVLAASIYKMAWASTGVSDEVKKTARRKCIALGFKPYIEDAVR